MDRHLVIAGIAAIGLGISAVAQAQAPATRRPTNQLLELRTYRFATADKQAAFEAFLEEAAIPAWNRAGISPVGIFKALKADNPKMEADSADLLVLLPHSGPRSLLRLAGTLDKDDAFQEAGKAILSAAKSDPAYTAVESSLMRAFDGIPKVEVPTQAESRILQLRIYQSHSADRGLRKIDMFEEGGELALFRKTGMDPVFFGRALAGTRLPNLTYMLSFENDEARKAAWDAFLAHPDWNRMKSDPKYKDTVSNITNTFLRPAAGSQI